MFQLSSHFGSRRFLSDKRNVRISETSYYMCYQNCSHIHADRETTGLFKTG